jgi:flagellar operon protein
MSIGNLDTKSLLSVDSIGKKPAAERISADLLKGPSFEDTLQSQVSGLDVAPVKKEAAPSVLKFSNHAVERMSQRGITFSPEQMTKIEGAVRKAAEKGSKEALVLAEDAALIVSLKDNTVVTVMDKANMKDNVFTKIDATIVV